MQKLPIIEKVPTQDLWKAEDKNTGGEPFSTHLRIAILRIPPPASDGRRGKNDSACKECKKVLMVAVLALHPGKAVVQVAAIQIAVNGFLEIGTKKSVGPLESFLVNLDEGFQMILDTTIIIGSLRIAGPVHDS